MAVTSKILLISSPVSLESKENGLLCCNKLERHVYKTNEPPITINKNMRMNNPLVGSVAKAWTEVKTPDRTRNVPSKLNENPPIASRTVHCLNAPRFSLTLKE